MLSPFPGIDPFIEDQGRWGDLHMRVLGYCCDALIERLPDDYVAQFDEQVYLVQPEPDTSRIVRPDVAILRDDSGPPGGRPRPGGAATLEPVAIALDTDVGVEVREVWLEILRLPDLRLVTALELFSPTNKVGTGRERYLAKRLALIERPIHLVELDLLVGGRRPPMRRELPRGDYFAFVSRAERRPYSDVYAWTVRDPLPTIPIPLESPDPDIPLDLAAILATAYDRGRYARLLRYDDPLSLAFKPDDRAWAEERGRASGR